MVEFGQVHPEKIGLKRAVKKEKRHQQNISRPGLPTSLVINTKMEKRATYTQRDVTVLDE